MKYLIITLTFVATFFVGVNLKPAQEGIVLRGFNPPTYQGTVPLPGELLGRRVPPGGFNPPTYQGAVPLPLELDDQLAQPLAGISTSPGSRRG